jgi:hypothetical protein
MQTQRVRIGIRQLFSGILILFIALSMMQPQFTSRAAPNITKLGETTLATTANTLLNGLSFQQIAIETYNGWQYVVWYNNVNSSTRQVNIKRRQLPNGAWSNIEFTDYNQTTNHDHNTISMGISTLDGTIHLAFDHHNNPIRYRRSVAGLATNPGSFSWTASQFGAVSSTLGGITVNPMTYPRFVRVPNGRLLLSVRIGASGDGDEHLYEYNGTGTWAALGKYLEGGTGNAYLHGLNYSSNGRLHATWTWRETPTWTTNHDLMYLYSEDNGRTWRNNAGTQVGVTGSTFVTQSTSGVRVWTIGQNTSLLNQEGQTVDSAGQVHVLNRDNLSGSVRYVHYFRTTNGTWNRRVLPASPTNLLQDRGKIVTDSNNNAYAILPNMRILSASASSNYNDWTVVNSVENGRFDREPQYDIYRVQSDGILSIFYKGLNNANLYILDYQLNTGTAPTVTPGGAVSVNDNTTGTGNNQFQYTGTWSYGSQSGAFQNDNHWSSVTNANYQVRFNGRQIRLYGAKAPNHGIAAVSIDGGTEVNVDFYATSRTDNTLLWTSPMLAAGNHTLRVRVTGTRNPSSSGNPITADRVDVTP